MAIRTVTTDPQPSRVVEGFWYARYNQRTRAGGEAIICFHPSLKDIVCKGFVFDDRDVVFDEALRASILAFDDAEAAGDLEIPAEFVPGEDVDHDPTPEAPNDTIAPGRTARSLVTRQRLNAQFHAPAAPAAPTAPAEPTEPSLPPELRTIAREVAQTFLYQLGLIHPAVGESRRGDIAQKLTAIACIPYYRERGVRLTDDDVKGMVI